MFLLSLLLACLADRFGWLDDDTITGVVQAAFIGDTILEIILS
jgi:hypothetical protein